MTWIAILLVLAGFVFVFSQFGGRVSASGALSWWLMGIFLAIAAVDPMIFRALATSLGIKFVSNFVLAGLVMFLFVQAFEQAGNMSTLKRQLRNLVASETARRFIRDRDKVSARTQPICLVIVPCYNEEQSLPEVIASLQQLSRSSPEIDFCIINDGSRDCSQEILEQLVPANFVAHSVNVGVSGVLLTGFKIARNLGAQYIVQCDADGQHPITEIPELLRQAVENRYDCLIGSRFCSGSQGEAASLQSTTPLRRLGGMTISLVLRILAPKGASVADPTSGFRVYSKDAAKLLMNEIPDEYPEPESLALMAIKGLKIKEIRVVMTARSGGVSSLGGTKSLVYMVKVISAMIGSKLRRIPSHR